MIQQGVDFGFVGEAYEAPMLLQDAQRCINWYCEVSEDKTNGSKMPIALLGCPGLQQVAVGTNNPGTFGGPVNFATGDGSTKSFNTLDPNLNIEQVFNTDWQGTQLQYTTPRTNIAVNNISTSGFNAGSSTLTLGVNSIGGPDNLACVFGQEGNTSHVWELFSAAAAGTIANGDFFTYVIDMHLTPGYANNENLVELQLDGVAFVKIDIASNTVISTSGGTVPVTAAFVASLPNGFSRFSFIVGPANYTRSTGPTVIADLNNGNTFVGDGVTQFYIRIDIKKSQTVSSWIKNNTGSAITVTDYSVSGSVANFQIAPLSGAVLSKQTYTPGQGGAQIRGMWKLPGNLGALVVAGSVVYLLTIGLAATATSSPTFNFKQVGTLLTAVGPVSIRDNGVAFGGAGGFAVIVDGTYGYYYLLSGVTNTVTFTGGVTSGQNTITVTSIPYGLVVTPSATITDTGGDIPANTTFSGGANFNSLTLTMSANATGTNASDTISISIPVFGQITDPAFLPASKAAFIEGWLIFSEPNTRTFFTTAAVPYTLLFAGSFYALKDSSTDNLVTLYENNRELWLIGERTSEVWYNAGNPNFPFARIPAIGPQIGCAALNSITRLGPNLVWLARNEQGQNIVVQQMNYDWERISTHAIDHAISSYPIVSDAVGFAYEEEGHWFYVLTFPTADATWVFDGKTKMWHQRASFDPATGLYHRFRANAFCEFADTRLVGDYQNGMVYQMSRQFYSDNGNPLRCQRRAPHTWEKQNRKRLFHSWLQVEFTPGVGLNTGQGSNPQAMLRWYDYNKNKNWSNEHWTTIGQTGQVTNRAIWRRLGSSRDRIYELNYSDPTPRDIIGVTLFFEPEDESEASLSRTAA